MSLVLGWVLLALSALGAVWVVAAVYSVVGTPAPGPGQGRNSEWAVGQSLGRIVRRAALLPLPAILGLYLVGANLSAVAWWSALAAQVALTAYLLFDFVALRHWGGVPCQGLRVASVGEKLLRHVLDLTGGLAALAYAGLVAGLWAWALPGLQGWVRGTAAGALVAAAAVGVAALVNARRIEGASNSGMSSYAVRERWDCRKSCRVAAVAAGGVAVLAGITLAWALWTGVGA